MVRIAATRARALELPVVHTAVRDLEAIEEAAAAFDIVLCREGLMFAVDVDNAVGEIHRVLRFGGRAAISVWGAKEENPWLGLVMDAVAAEVGHPVAPPGAPGPLALSNTAGLVEILERHGFSSVTVDRIGCPVAVPSVEAWWQRSVTLAGPLATVVDQLDLDSTECIVARLRQSASSFAGPDGLVLPAVAHVLCGKRGG